MAITPINTTTAPTKPLAIPQKVQITSVATASDAGEGVAELRARVASTLSRAKDGLIEAQCAVVDKAKAAARATDGYVHENPWKSVGIAAGVGLLLGMLIGRR